MTIFIIFPCTAVAFSLFIMHLTPPSAGCICPEIPYSQIFTVTPYFLSSWLWKPVCYPVCGFDCLGTCHELGDVAC